MNCKYYSVMILSQKINRIYEEIKIRSDVTENMFKVLF